jgi:hypothetical protein
MAVVFLSSWYEVLISTRNILVDEWLCSVMSVYSAITGDNLILESNLANYCDVSDIDVANGSRGYFYQVGTTF